MRRMRLTVVDSFADRPFRGNPAAVCVSSMPFPEAGMRLLAREMALSETAFLVPEGAHHRLRWFTPAVEVSLCGHATLAAAHVLWQRGLVAPHETVRFMSQSGPLQAIRSGLEIELDFPSEPASATPVSGAALEVVEALGASPVWAGRNRLDTLIEISSESEVRGLRPDFASLKRLSGAGRGVIVTSQAEPGSGFDFVSRFFAPAAGIDEDPVTGSAHCALGPYWAAKLGKTELLGYQASERGGRVGVGVAGDRVKLRGTAVTVLEVELSEAALAEALRDSG